MGHGKGGVRLQHQLLLVGILVLREFALFLAGLAILGILGILAILVVLTVLTILTVLTVFVVLVLLVLLGRLRTLCILGRSLLETVVGLLQEGEVVIERLHV